MGKPREEGKKQRPEGPSKYALKQMRRRIQGELAPAREPPPPPPPPFPTQSRTKSQQVRLRIVKAVPEKGFVLEGEGGRTLFLPIKIVERDCPDAELYQELECVAVPHKHRPEDLFVIKVLRIIT